MGRVPVEGLNSADRPGGLVEKIKLAAGKAVSKRSFCQHIMWEAKRNSACGTQAAVLAQQFVSHGILPLDQT
jgi:hypothetical protein